VDELKALLQAQSVAVIGASTKSGALGHRVIDNLHRSGFTGAVLPVHPRHPTVLRIHCHRSVEALPFTPDLAIVCTPAQHVVEQMQLLGARGVRAAIVMAHDPDGETAGTPLKRAIEEVAQRHGMRWLGPRSAGMQLPRTGLNASWMEFMPPPGKLALVAQSSSLAASVLELAAARQIGFSTVVTLGDGGNVDESDVLDYLATDGRTQGVLLHLHKITDGTKFMASARALARLKPVVVLWADSPDETAHDGGAPVVDHGLVCQAAFDRAGLLRVNDIGSWFDAVEMLGYGRRHVGDRLAIVCNGMGPALLARATLAHQHPLVDLGDPVKAELKPLLPKGIAPANPLNLGVDAGAARYEAAMTALLKNDATDALLVIVTPCRSAHSDEIATVVAKVARSSGRAVMVCWLGGASQTVHSILALAEVPVFDAPALAAQAYLHMVRFRRAQEALKQIPDQCTVKSSSSANQVVGLSDEAESMDYVLAYGQISMAIMEDRPEISGAQALAVLAAVGLHGITPMPHDPSSTQPARAHQVIPLKIKVGDDPAFGRAIEASVGSRRCTLLPALNTELATGPSTALSAELELLSSSTLTPEIVARALCQVADLLVGFPEIVGIEILDFCWDGSELHPRDPRVWVKENQRGHRHLAIQPYPMETEEKIVLRDGRVVLIRPLRPDVDIPFLAELLANVATDDLFMRFAKVIQGIPPEVIAKMARVDYDREMGFVALTVDPDGKPVLLGVVDAFVMPDLSEAEFSILLRSDLKRSGLGTALMRKIISYCSGRDIKSLVGMILKKNQGMRGLASHLGFSSEADPDDDMVTVTLPLTKTAR
jgi:acetyltransferase